MKYSLLAGALAFAGSVFASQQPYEGRLSQSDANEIVAQFQSLLQNTTYEGKPPSVTVNDIIAPDYHEYSDSILSLISKNSTLGTAAATTREQWYDGVKQHPIPNITTHDILVAGRNKVLWYWTFRGIGINRYPVKGFNLLRIDTNFQVYEADIEFNNIAWGVDIFEIQQYCSGPARRRS